MPFASAYKDQLLRAIDTIDLQAVERAVQWFCEARDHGRQAFVCGNGGSAATASHFVCDVLKGTGAGPMNRMRIMAFTDSIATITAYSNDVSYDFVFVEQLKSFANRGDVFMALSGSGNSRNVVKAMEYAVAHGCKTIALTGREGGDLGRLADLNINVAEPHMGRIEDGHLMICHMIAYAMMDETAGLPRPSTPVAQPVTTSR